MEVGSLAIADLVAGSSVVVGIFSKGAGAFVVTG